MAPRRNVRLSEGGRLPRQSRLDIARARILDPAQAPEVDGQSGVAHGLRRQSGDGRAREPVSRQRLAIVREVAASYDWDTRLTPEPRKAREPPARRADRGDHGPGDGQRGTRRVAPPAVHPTAPAGPTR